MKRIRKAARIGIAGWLAFLVPALAWHGQAAETGVQVASAQDVTWLSLGTNENDSMPIGNGDLAANVWTEQDGSLVVLLAKSDAWTELGKLVKLGRLRLSMVPNPFAGSPGFSQKLFVENGSVEIKSGSNTLRVWVDANRPVMEIQAHMDKPSHFKASLELWRTSHSLRGASPEKGAMYEVGSDSMPVDFEADTVLAGGGQSVAWCHYNMKSIFPWALRQEHLDSLVSKFPDPLLHRCFGGMLQGPGLTASSSTSLESKEPQTDFRMQATVLTQTNVQEVKDWQDDLENLGREEAKTSQAAAWREHQLWWSHFWNRSWILVEGDADAARVTHGYVMQRYMMAASSRGAFPVKFNGGLFTVGHDLPEDANSSNGSHNPDYRAWGNCYWNQNNRLLYWPLLESGDEDLIKPWFDMYSDDLPLEEARNQMYYHQNGASYPETMFFFGLPSLHDFGWNNPSNTIQSAWQRYHIQGGLEVVAQMLDAEEDTGDLEFARKQLVPVADAVVTYYGQHWPLDETGHIRMAPSQSLETYQLDAVNPTPDIAGLRSDIPRLLALSQGLATEEQKSRWTRIYNELPPIPLGRTTASGRVPPMGIGATNGLETILPAEHYGKTHNSENPELYVAFPYHLMGVGKPGLELARIAYKARRSPQKTCWGQDGTEAAALGLTSEAQATAVAEFTNYGDERFPWFWRPAHDWIPDLDNGGSGMMTLESMLMQCDGKKILLLPAWPSNWSAQFKLHAPFSTVVEGTVSRGRVVRWKVFPASRAGDVKVWREQMGR